MSDDDDVPLWRKEPGAAAQAALDVDMPDWLLECEAKHQVRGPRTAALLLIALLTARDAEMYPEAATNGPLTGWKLQFVARGRLL